MPVDLIGLAQTGEQSLMQTLPDALALPVPQAPPTRHATAKSQGLGELLPGDTAGEDKENAVKDRPVIQAGPAATRGADGLGNQRLQKRPELWSDELSLHARRT